jgi:hypothetical protein
LTWNEGRIKIVRYVMVANISYSKTINRFQIKTKDQLFRSMLHRVSLQKKLMKLPKS